MRRTVWKGDRIKLLFPHKEKRLRTQTYLVQGINSEMVAQWKDQLVVNGIDSFEEWNFSIMHATFFRKKSPGPNHLKRRHENWGRLVGQPPFSIFPSLLPPLLFLTLSYNGSKRRQSDCLCFHHSCNWLRFDGVYCPWWSWNEKSKYNTCWWSRLLTFNVCPSFLAPRSCLVKGSWPPEGTEHGTTTSPFWSSAPGSRFR